MEEYGPCDNFVRCGNQGEWTLNPYVFEIYGEEEWLYLCDDCCADYCDEI